jgi:hypothetical protein
MSSSRCARKVSRRKLDRPFWKPLTAGRGVRDRDEFLDCPHQFEDSREFTRALASQWSHSAGRMIVRSRDTRMTSPKTQAPRVDGEHRTKAASSQ